jgi:hypothetical protein
MDEKRPSGSATLEDFDGFEFVFDQGYCARIARSSEYWWRRESTPTPCK